ncbi:MAG: efflux RND transporter periplasmic adaptor subunit [Planctomycetes bacterium]|nr:efflux RND transporter periplasmic adaptor subunit [Planctomycetota bacterium]MCB9909012.1 efflux RND transporter periplasmic adaptor subunit [Planctomycetota bacterium]MCB9911743.1 efflux RND transporter periplasmic adaptor subunit [Planctomycetota bacterium]
MKSHQERIPLIDRQRALLASTAFVLCLGLGCSPAHEDHHGKDHGTGQEGAAHEPHSESMATSGDAHPGEHPGEDGHVELSEQQFQAAGIQTTVAKPGRVFDALTLPGTVAPNSDAVLHVTPRVSGQVRSVTKHLGESVQAGEVVCILDSVELGAAAANYLRDRERVRAAEETLAREQELYAGRLEALQTVLEGGIAIQERIYSREEDLQKKAVSTVRPLLEADKALQLAKLELAKNLTELRADRDSRLLELDVDLRTKRIDLAAAANLLRIMGFDAQEVTGLHAESPILAGEYRVYAPGNGVVVNRHASTGEFVEAGAKLYIIEDLSSVWFVASAFEEQLQSVRTLQAAHITLDAFPGTILNGAVSFVDYHVDATSRSVGVRITLDNTELESWPEEYPLRPGMFGRAQLETTARQAGIVLPEAALVHDDAGDYVFVQVEPLAFEHRDVVVQPVADGLVEVLAGLTEGESIAVSGTFFLKSAERMGELGGGHSH